MKSIRRERGQAAVLTVVFLVVFLGMAGLVLDVGSWFREQRSTQSAADASALAAAQALPENTATASALASQYVAKNGGGVASVTFNTTSFANDTVTVRVQRDAPGVFAKLFGIDSVNVGAKASARAGSPAAAKYAAPIGVDKLHPLLAGPGCPCFNESTQLRLEKIGPGAFRFLNIDGSSGGTGSQDLAAWILSGFDGYMPLGWYGSDPGAKTSSNIFAAMKQMIGEELLFPIYSRTQGGGSNFTYEVVGWVGFLLTDFIKVQGNDKIIEGHFVRVIWEGILSTSGSSNGFGVRTIQLVE
jgi:secretion/DNA translocation related TadE-like protein